jgi:RNA polymerase sigma-70 factor, ECF subfamily
VGAEAVYVAEQFPRRRELPVCRVWPPGERERFERLLDRYHRRLRRVVAGVLADPDRVDDVLQDAYLKAFRRLPASFANEAHEAAWLYRIVYRCCLDELRRRRRRRESSTPDSELARVASLNEPQARLELDEAFRALPARDRAVLLLVGVVGLDQESAASVLGIPRGTLASRLSSARAHFREALSR